MSELKPCPFCGSTTKPENVTIDNADREGVPACLRCEDCGCCAPWKYVQCDDVPGDDPVSWAELAVEWNKRPIEDALRAEIAALKAAKARAGKAWFLKPADWATQIHAYFAEEAEHD